MRLPPAVRQQLMQFYHFRSKRATRLRGPVSLPPVAAMGNKFISLKKENLDQPCLFAFYILGFRPLGKSYVYRFFQSSS